MDAPALDHLLRTMAAVPTDRRVLVRGADEGEAARPLAQLGFEVHAAPWTDESAKEAHRCLQEAAPGSGYAAAAPPRALPYPEGHFGWIVTRVPPAGEAPAEEHRALLTALLEEARHHLRPGGWVFVAAPAGLPPEALAAAAEEAALAIAEAPERTEQGAHALYRRVDEHTPL